MICVFCLIYFNTSLTGAVNKLDFFLNFAHLQMDLSIETKFKGNYSCHSHMYQETSYIKDVLTLFQKSPTAW